MKTLLKPIFMITTMLTGLNGNSQTPLPTIWTTQMQVKMYTKSSSPYPGDSITIGTESFIVSEVESRKGKAKLNISAKELNEILATFNKYKLTEITPIRKIAAVSDGWTNFLVFTNGDKSFTLETGPAEEITNKTQQKNKDSIYAFLNALVDKHRK